MAYSESQSSTTKRAAAAQLSFTKGPNTCGFIESPTSAPTTSPDDQAWTCPGPCISSNSFLGCRSPVPTKCLGSSVDSIAGGCRDGELCCKYRPDTACYTWLSTDEAATFTLYECSSTSGTGNLLASPTALSDPILTTILGSTSSNIPTGSETSSVATASSLPTWTQEPQQEASKGAIAASVAGALAFLGLLAGGVVYLYVWNKKKKKREGFTGLNRRGSMAISGPYMVSGLPPKFPPPPPPPAPPRPPISPGVYDMEVFDQGRGTSSMYSTGDYVETGYQGVVPPPLNAPGRPRRDGEAVSGGWI